MGRVFVVELEGRSYRCKFCRTHLALPDDLVSRHTSYHRRSLRFMNSKINIVRYPPVLLKMLPTMSLSTLSASNALPTRLFYFVGLILSGFPLSQRKSISLQ
ncbi:protein yippee-like At5g53940 isoform X2 [Carica papaya]|uniref:protein yippee-like At5g53940 isoform X2 n=1 Tax=Carica papaya TaxID=3649 RepID=UPI000B8C8A90|nr:protein yippee-like At5g53940 isoform X2 [Carica papaya]